MAWVEGQLVQAALDTGYAQTLICEELAPCQQIRKAKPLTMTYVHGEKTTYEHMTCAHGEKTTY